MKTNTINSKSFKELKKNILNSTRSELSKKMLIFLLNESRKLTTEVCLSLTDKCNGYDATQIRSLTDDFNEVNLTEFLKLIKSKFIFNLHYGNIIKGDTENKLNTDGMFAGIERSFVTSDEFIREGMPLRYTFWLSKKLYSKEAKILKITKEKLEQIKLN